MSDKQNVELIVEYLDKDIKIYTLVKFAEYDTKPQIVCEDEYIDFKYVAMGKIRYKLIPYSAIKNIEIYEE